MVLSVPEQRWVTLMRLHVVYDVGRCRSPLPFTVTAKRVGLEERQSIAAPAPVITSSAGGGTIVAVQFRPGLALSLRVRLGPRGHQPIALSTYPSASTWVS